MRSAARPAVPRLSQLVNERNSRPNQNYDLQLIDVGWLLAAIGADPQEIIGVIAPLLIKKDTSTCFHAGRLLAIASPEDARRQVSLLVPQLAPEKIAEKTSALSAVCGMAPEAQEAIPALSRLLECDERGVAYTAARALGGIGPAAASAVPALVAQLARGLESHDYSARSASCEAIGKMGPAAESAIPALVAELNDAPLSLPPQHDIIQRAGQRPVREAMSALVRIGNTNPEVLAAIRRHLSNETELLRSWALSTVARLTPDSPEALNCCLNCLRANHWSNNRRGIILPIGRLAGDRKDAVTPLAALLDDGDPEIRKAAAWALGKIGTDASAVPYLREALSGWVNSLYSFHSRPYSQPWLADDPRSRLENSRRSDVDDLVFFNGIKDLQFQEKSVQQFVREAIAQIEAGSNEPRPQPLP